LMRIKFQYFNSKKNAKLEYMRPIYTNGIANQTGYKTRKQFYI
jgi:hypothetical protein